jgi:hypothetical protein
VPGLGERPFDEVGRPQRARPAKISLCLDHVGVMGALRQSEE